MGPFNLGAWKYDYIYTDDDKGIQWSLDVVSKLMALYGQHPALYAFEPVNEPWWGSDYDVLKSYYRQARNIIRDVNPNVIFTFHDGFDFSASRWNDLFEDNDMENVVIDTHFYQAWWGASSLQTYCSGYYSLSNGANSIKYPVWVGEWALATDVCALWLGGFNDANTAAVYDCEYVDCPAPYLPADTAVDFDRTADSLGPFGTAKKDNYQHAFIKNGKCAKDSTYFSEADTAILGGCAIRAFNDVVEGHFLWTFRNELEDRWNYVTAYDKGWLNASNPLPGEEEIYQ
jgi:hypothetical protein